MNKAYHRINNGKGWENYPSDKTAVDEFNLNHMEIGIDEIDNRVVVLEDTKATKLEVSELFRDVSLDLQSGIITFTRKNGATVIIDTPIEKIQTGIYYNPVSEMLVLPLIDGTSMEVDLSRLMKFDEFIDSDTIAFSVKANGAITALVKEGSIEEKHLRPDYLADIRLEQSKAQSSAVKSEEFAKLSESYTHGGTGVREGEETDNAMEYARQAKESADRAEDIISQGDTAEIVTIEKSLSPGVDWIDTGIHKGDLKTGSYMVTLFVNETEYGALRETYAGIMHWYSDTTYPLIYESNEILLHSSGYKTIPERRFFLRTRMQSSYGLILEIASSKNPSLEKVLNLVFKFKKLL